MDHDFYTLEDAAKVLGCTNEDLIKLGATEKIELRFWCTEYFSFDKHEKDCKLEEIGINFTDSINKFLPVVYFYIMDLYLNYKKNGPSAKVEIGITTWPWSGPTNKYYPFFLEKSQLISVDDLFITHETFVFLKKEFQNVPAESLAPCFDQNSLFHARELKIAIETWSALFEKKEMGDPLAKIRDKPGGAISAIKNWLKKNYPDESENARVRIAQVVNPFKGGGVPKK